MGRNRVTLGGDHRGLHAGADNLHGALGVVREQRAVQLHADIELAAEAAARGGLDAADVVLGNAKHAGDLVAVIVGVLRGSDDRHDALLVIVGDAGIRLDEHVGEDVGGVGVLDDNIALAPGFVHIAELHVLLGMDVRRAVDEDRALRHRALVGVDDGQLFVFDLDELHGFLYDLRGLRRDNGDGVAVAAHLVVHEAGLVFDDDAKAVLAGDGGMVEDGGDAGQRAGLLEIQLFDVGVGNGAAEHAAIEHVGHVVVRGKLRAAEHLVERVDLDMVTAEDSYVSHASASSPRILAAARSTASLILA